MELINPIMLAGTIGAVVPVIIHLIQRQRAPEHVFPPARFLMDAQQEVSRRVRLRDWLVMLMRALFIALLALALAQPILEQTESLGLSEQPTACVVVVDDSLSMQYRAESDRDSCFERAKRKGMDLLTRLRQFDQSAVVTFSGRKIGTGAFNNQHESTIEALENLSPGYGNYQAENAVMRARKKLARSELEKRRIIILSDFSRSAWSRAAYDLLAAEEYQVSMPEITDWRESRANRYFYDTQISTSGRSILVRSNVGYRGEKALGSGDVSFLVREKIRDKKTIDGRGATVRFRAENDHRRYSGHLKLSSDPLRADNFLYFAGRSAAHLNVLLVEGDPRENMYHNETYHLDLALSGGGNSIRTDVVTPVRLGQVQMAQYDCAVFANVRWDDMPDAERLEEYLNGGGSIWMILGGQTQKTTDPFGDLVSLELRSIQGDKGGEKTRIDIDNLDHPVFDGFSPRWITEFKKVNIHRWWLLDGKGGGETIMRLNNGAPLLWKKRVGGGKVYVLTSPLNRKWNDLPMRSVFVPFVQRLTRHMAGALVASGKQQLWVGDKYDLEVPEGIEKVFVKQPNSDEYGTVKTKKMRAGRSLNYQETGRPGVYSVARNPDGADVLALFAVNPRPDASDIRLFPRHIEHQRRVTLQGESGKAAAQSTDGTGVYHLLFWACLCLLCAESIAAWW